MPDERPAGHQEAQRKIPDPLDRPRFWNPLAGLPSYVISRISIVILAMILLLPVADRPARYLFKLPIDPEWLLGLAMGLAASVLLVCRHRPGRLFPRIWALLLTSAALLALFGRLLGAATWGIDSPYFHFTALALLCASASLASRLMRLQPDSVWIRRIPYVSVSIGLSCFLTLYLPVARQINTVVQQERLEAVLRDIGRLTSTVEKLTRHPWPQAGDDLTATEELVDELCSLAVPADCRDLSLWRLTAAAGRLTELKAAIRKAVRAGVEALRSGLVPPPRSEPGVDFPWNEKERRYHHRSEENLLDTLVVRRQDALKGILEGFSASSAAVAGEPVGELREFAREIEAEKMAAMEKASDPPPPQGR